MSRQSRKPYRVAAPSKAESYIPEWANNTAHPVYATSNPTSTEKLHESAFSIIGNPFPNNCKLILAAFSKTAVPEKNHKELGSDRSCICHKPRW
jgi:hypothetical protein